MERIDLIITAVVFFVLCVVHLFIDYAYDAGLFKRTGATSTYNQHNYWYSMACIFFGMSMLSIIYSFAL